MLVVVTSPLMLNDDEQLIVRKPGFRIGVICETGRFVIASVCGRDLVFGRRIDAEMAIRALNSAGLNSAENLREAGFQKIKRIASEAMQW